MAFFAVMITVGHSTCTTIRRCPLRNWPSTIEHAPYRIGRADPRPGTVEMRISTAPMATIVVMLDSRRFSSLAILGRKIV